jgi:hypothetical protein
MHILEFNSTKNAISSFLTSMKLNFAALCAGPSAKSHANIFTEAESLTARDHWDLYL